MRRFLLLFSILLNFHAFSQIKVYSGENTFLSDLVYQVEGNTVYRYSNPAIKTDILYIEGDKVYLKDRKFFNDIKYTVVGNTIYQGNSTTTFDKLYTLKEGKLYVGDGTFSSHCLYTFQDGKIYQGDSTSSFDIIMSYEIDSPSELIKVAMLVTPY